jgi:hypothetical protein
MRWCSCIVPGLVSISNVELRPVRYFLGVEYAEHFLYPSINFILDVTFSWFGGKQQAKQVIHYTILKRTFYIPTPGGKKDESMYYMNAVAPGVFNTRMTEVQKASLRALGPSKTGNEHLREL